jgi:hypothetical protein
MVRGDQRNDQAAGLWPRCSVDRSDELRRMGLVISIWELDVHAESFASAHPSSLDTDGSNAGQLTV